MPEMEPEVKSVPFDQIHGPPRFWWAPGTVIAEDPIASLEKMAKKYGGIFRMHMHGKDWVVISSPTLAEQVFDTTKFTRQNPFSFAALGNYKNSPWTHLPRRPRPNPCDITKPHYYRLVEETFSEDSVGKKFDRMIDSITQLVLKVARLRQFDPRRDFERLSLEVLSHCIMDTGFRSFYQCEYDHPERRRITDDKYYQQFYQQYRADHPFKDETLVRLQRVLGMAGRNRDGWTILNGLFWSQKAAIKKELEPVWFDVLERVKARHDGKVQYQTQHQSRQSQHNGELHDRSGYSEPEETDFLDRLMTAMAADQANPYPKKADPSHWHCATDNILTLLLTDYYPLSEALFLSFYHIFYHRSIREKVYMEIQEVIGSDKLKLDHLPRLHFLASVLRGTFRHYPIIPAASFDANPDFGDGSSYDLEDHEGEGNRITRYKIPRDSPVLVLLGLERLRDKSSKDFDPDRFLDKTGNFSDGVLRSSTFHSATFLGPHFVPQLLLMTIATLVQNFKFEFKPEKHKLNFSRGLILKYEYSRHPSFMQESDRHLVRKSKQKWAILRATLRTTFLDKYPHYRISTFLAKYAYSPISDFWQSWLAIYPMTPEAQSQLMAAQESGQLGTLHTIPEESPLVLPDVEENGARRTLSIANVDETNGHPPLSRSASIRKPSAREELDRSNAWLTSFVKEPLMQAEVLWHRKHYLKQNAAINSGSLVRKMLSRLVSTPSSTAVVTPPSEALPRYVSSGSQTLTFASTNPLSSAAVESGSTLVDLPKLVNPLSITSEFPVTVPHIRAEAAGSGSDQLPEPIVPISAETGVNPNQSSSSFSRDAVKNLYIYFGSNNGTCKAYAERLSVIARQKGFLIVCEPLNSVTNNLPKRVPIVIIAATYEGAPTDDGLLFCTWISTLNRNELEHVNFAIFGFGHVEWGPLYQKVPICLEQQMVRCGAIKICERGEADPSNAGSLTTFDVWIDQVFWPALQRFLPCGDPFDVEVVGCKRGRVLAKYGISTEPIKNILLQIQLPSGMGYHVGDYLSVWPENSKDDVDLVMQHFGISKHSSLRISKSGTSMTDRTVSTRHYLTYLVNLSEPTSKLAVEITLKRKGMGLDSISDQRQFDHDLDKLTLIQIVRRHLDRSFSLSDFLWMLPRMHPIHYQILSAPNAEADSPYDCTIAYEVPEEIICQQPRKTAHSYLHQLNTSDTLRVSVHSSTLGLPKPGGDLRDPVIMICTSGGIAPFRAFLEDRARRAPLVRRHGKENSTDSVNTFTQENMAARFRRNRQKSSGSSGNNIIPVAFGPVSDIIKELRNSSTVLLYVECSPEAHIHTFEEDLRTWAKAGIVLVKYSCSQSSDTDAPIAPVSSESVDSRGSGGSLAPATHNSPPRISSAITLSPQWDIRSSPAQRWPRAESHSTVTANQEGERSGWSTAPSTMYSSCGSSYVVMPSGVGSGGLVTPATTGSPPNSGVTSPVPYHYVPEELLRHCLWEDRRSLWDLFSKFSPKVYISGSSALRERVEDVLKFVWMEYNPPGGGYTSDRALESKEVASTGNDDHGREWSRAQDWFNGLQIRTRYCSDEF